MASKELTFEDRCKFFEKCATEIGWEVRSDTEDGMYVITQPIFLSFEIGDADWIRFKYVAAYHEWFKNSSIQDYCKWLNKKKWRTYALDRDEEILEFADIINVPDSIFETFLPVLIKMLDAEVPKIIKTARDYIDIMDDE